jgi:hypothetical protein
MKKQTSEVISGGSLVNYVNGVLNLGLDVHYRQVTVAMQEDGGRIKAAGKMGHAEFLNWVQKRDAGELCDSLERYLRGHKKALSVVAVPTEEQEEKRALIRYHRQICMESITQRYE